MKNIHRGQMCSSHQSNRLRRESSGGNREWEVKRKSLMLCAQTDCLGLQFGILMCDRWSVSAWGVFLVCFGSVTVSLNKTWPEEENMVCYWVSCMLFLSVGGLVLYIININNGDSFWWGQRDLIAVMHAYTATEIFQLKYIYVFPKGFSIMSKKSTKSLSRWCWCVYANLHTSLCLKDWCADTKQAVENS